MVVTQITLALSIVLLSGILAALVGAIGEKNASRYLILSVIVFCIVVPTVMFGLYMILEVYVSVQDWTFHGGSFLGLWNPASAIFLVSGICGFLGMYAGKYWRMDEDRSCLQCLLGPIIIVFLLSIVILILP